MISNKNKNILSDLDMITVSIRSLNRGLDRSQNIADPVLRHTIFIDRIRLIFDTVFPILEKYIKDVKTDEEILDDENVRMIHSKIEETKTLINNFDKSLNVELDALVSWIINPVYSPDHPFGKNYCDHLSEKYNEKK